MGHRWGSKLQARRVLVTKANDKTINKFKVCHTPDVSDAVLKKLFMSGGSARGEDVERGEAVAQRGDLGDVPISGRACKM